MRQLTFEHRGAQLRRVPKNTARKAYDRGASVWMLPAMMNPRSPWAASMLYEASRHSWGRTSATFEDQTNAFTYYNCNAELGAYPAYFIEEGGAR